MKNDLKKFIAFKLEQKLNLIKGGNDYTKEEITDVMKNNIADWCREAIVAGI